MSLVKRYINQIASYMNLGPFSVEKSYSHTSLAMGLDQLSQYINPNHNFLSPMGNFVHTHIYIYIYELASHALVTY